MVVKVKVRACGHREGVEELLYSFSLSAKWGGWLMAHTGHFTPRNGPVPIVLEVG
jgi:hypothetical protein